MNITQEKKNIAANLQLNGVTLSQSYLRVEKAVTTQGSIAFDPNKTNNTALVTENKLAQNDGFVVTHIGVALKKVASATPTDAQQVAALLYNYRNSSVFDGTNEGNLQSVYNGKLKVTIDNVTYFPSLDCRSFERVPTSQGGAVTAAITGPTTYTMPRDGYENGLFGYYPVDPFIIKGTDKNDFEINLGASVDMSESGETNYVVLLIKGYLVQNYIG